MSIFLNKTFMKGVALSMKNEISGLRKYLLDIITYLKDEYFIEYFENILNSLFSIIEAPCEIQEYLETLVKKHYVLNSLFASLSNKLDKQISLTISKLTQTFGSQLKELKKALNNTIGILDRYDSLELLITELLYNRENTIERLGKYSDIMCHLCHDLQGTLLKLEDVIYQGLCFKGRSFYETRQEIYEILYELADTVTSLMKRVKDFRRVIEIAKGFMEYHESIKARLTQISGDVILVVNQLASAMREGIWASSIIDIVTGLKSITAEPTLEKISLILPDKEPSELSLNELFYRYPPYEPIAIKFRKNIGIMGDLIWFLNSENISGDLRQRFKGALILHGEVQPEGTQYVRLINVKPISVLDTRNHVIKVSVKSGRSFIHIKYGSSKLGKLLRIPRINERFIQSIYEKTLKAKGISKHGKAYLATNLTYVWYCRLGYAMSTDPWDLDCPFKSKCGKGKQFKGRCPLWSSRRRLFPKIFGVKEHRVQNPSQLQEHLEERYGLLTPITGTNIYLTEIYKGVQWNMPSDFGIGSAVQVFFKREIIRKLPKTNIIGFSLPYRIIKAYILELLDQHVVPKPTLSKNILGTHVTLDKLLISKFFIFYESGRGRTIFNLLQRSQKTLLRRFNNFVKKIYENKGAIFDDLIDYCVHLLSHTLAHAFYTFICRQLELEYKDLIYLDIIDREKDRILIIIAENSPLGVIDIIRHAKERFNESLRTMLVQFIEQLISFLNLHTYNVMKYTKESRDLIVKRIEELSKAQEYGNLKELIECVKNYYEEFIKNGLVMDIHTLQMHLLLSSAYEKMAAKCKVPLATAFDIIGHVLTCLGIPYCLDGCPSCIMLEHGCKEHVMQNIALSRELLLFFLNTLFCGSSFEARGGRLGSQLISNLTKRKLVAITPYIDKQGERVLRGLINRGVEVVLVTREGTVKQLDEYIINHSKIFIPARPRHDKLYIIDDVLLIETTWNLTPGYDSLNTFSVRIIDKQQALNIINQVISNARLIKT